MSKVKSRVLGSVGYLRKFVPNFGPDTAILNELLKKDVPWNWTRLHEQHFRKVFQQLGRQILLSTPTAQDPFLMITDASNKGIAAILAQRQKESLKLIELYSRKLTDAERR
eukprot:GHVP01070991.1.p1 GENE.GHVP01070991.1~~GHVP01070991.1.p1  ORF type:complete len:111 (-),score=3.52 GHVP01070991.1:68-400(-)